MLARGDGSCVPDFSAAAGDAPAPACAAGATRPAPRAGREARALPLAAGGAALPRRRRACRRRRRRRARRRRAARRRPRCPCSSTRACTPTRRAEPRRCSRSRRTRRSARSPTATGPRRTRRAARSRRRTTARACAATCARRSAAPASTEAAAPGVLAARSQTMDPDARRGRRVRSGRGTRKQCDEVNWPNPRRPKQRRPRGACARPARRRAARAARVGEREVRSIGALAPRAGGAAAARVAARRSPLPLGARARWFDGVSWARRTPRCTSAGATSSTRPGASKRARMSTRPGSAADVATSSSRRRRWPLAKATRPPTAGAAGRARRDGRARRGRGGRGGEGHVARARSSRRVALEAFADAATSLRAVTYRRTGRWIYWLRLPELRLGRFLIANLSPEDRYARLKAGDE